MRLNFQVRLYPNKPMKVVLDSLCDYRRYCWNQGLELWNTLYEQRLIGLPVELRAKIKASLTDKTIEFSDEEQALRVLFPAPTQIMVQNELVAQKADCNTSFLRGLCYWLLKTWRPLGTYFSTIQKRPINLVLKVVRNRSKVSKRTALGLSAVV